MITVDEDRVDATPEMKNALVGADCLPYIDLSDSRVELSAGVPTFELQASDGDANGGTTNHELDNTIEPPNNKPENSESLANEQSNNVDASDNNQQVNFEAPPNNPSIEYETPSENQPVSSEVTLDQKFYAEVNSEEIPNDGGVVVSEMQHNNEVALPETQHNNGMVIFETQQSNEVVMSEEQTINDVVMTKAMTENELAISPIDSNHHLSYPEETHSHNHHFADFHMIPEDQLPQPESLPSCEFTTAYFSATDAQSSLRHAFDNVLVFFILILISVLAFSIRLFAVIKSERVIHEFNPCFNYKVTQFLSKNGIYDFWNWFDDWTWYPFGRVIGGTVYPCLTLTAGTLWWVLNSLNIPLSVESVCVFTTPIFSAFASWATYLLTKEVKGSRAGLTATLFWAMVPSYISRSVAGSCCYICFDLHFLSLY